MAHRQTSFDLEASSAAGTVCTSNNNSNAPQGIAPPPPPPSAFAGVAPRQQPSIAPRLRTEPPARYASSPPPPPSVIPETQDAQSSLRLRRRPSMSNSHFEKFFANAVIMDPNAYGQPLVYEADGGNGGDGASAKSSRQQTRVVDMRRLGMYEDVIMRLRDPIRGIEIRDRTRLFKQYPQTFLGSELVDWLVHHCNLLTKDEGARFASGLFDAGYIISVDLSEKFVPDNTAYVFQTSYLWPSVNTTSTDKDYLAYLLRRNLRTSAKFQLSEIEDRRLLRLKKKFRKYREEFEGLVQDQLDHIELLAKADRRLFSLQEYAFWRMQRPLDPEANYLPIKEVDHVKRSQTEAQYEAKLPPAERLVFWEKKRDVYEASLSLNRLKVSTASKALIQRSEIMKGYDPFVDLSVNNPFITDDIKQMGTTENSLFLIRTYPSRQDLLLWCNSFQDLLRDPLVLTLGQLVVYRDFLAEAESIFDEFIQVGSRRELNITAGMRTAIINQFAVVRGGGTKLQTLSQASMDSSQSSQSRSATPPISPVSVTYPNSSSGSYRPGSPPSPPHQPLSPTSPRTSVTRKANHLDTVRGRMSNFVFRDAQDYILNLMAKDSYSRFLAWETLNPWIALGGRVMRRNLSNAAPYQG
ncbi:hypothetical protein BC829DRAFT_381161 [Chytridium lagenaria]|nr:hypothetical protein BC829DRAFT_381161 [Chytridium lagenaria]